ncbi:hypothetical protein HPB47_027402 [Ixodes persulcatus]|uniref:Uncharacterized protein n=1 Tax=Ixodes persulcatus TaxID=34615 RepID=A0AC60PY05_IXOPE|nr:hypothetical protein HPB47_027402 [Ixodes persulcatus]
MNCELGDSEVWLYNTSSESAAGDQAGEQQEAEGLGEPSSREDRAGGAEPQAPLPPQRRYFLSVSRVSYGRETKVRTTGVAALTEEEDTPTHLLAVHGLRGAWTKHNRDVVFGLFDSYVGAKLLRRNLSTDALRGFRVDAQPLASPEMRPSPRPARRGASPAVSMLQQLVSESSGPRTVYTEDVEGPGTEEEQLHGVAACQANDVLHKNWLVELVNSQVMLRGCETSGYVIVSAAKAQILQRLHSPVWKENTLVSKTTWVGSLDFMQYYATVDVGERGPSEDGVVWLTLDNIEERASTVINDLPDLVGSGQGVGGVVSNTVGGASDPNTAPLQLQRIISRCGCQFFYASYGENIDPDGLEEVPPLPDEEEEEPWGREAAVDAFTLTHHDLEVCSNPLQYAMVLDLVNNLLLYVEPRRREANERLQRMRFRLQLSAGEDHRTPILQLQDQVRSLLSMQRHLEREAYQVQRSLNDDPGNPDLEADLAHLEHEIHECKEKLSASSKELAMIISCYRETQVAALKTHQRASSLDQEVSVVRRAEVCFKHAHWRLTDVDGQLGIADLVLSNFLREEEGRMEEEEKKGEEARSTGGVDEEGGGEVGGISVKEHLEVNLVPITIGLTHAFTRRMLRFFFLTRDTGLSSSDKSEDHLEEEPKPVTHTRRARRSQQPPASTRRHSPSSSAAVTFNNCEHRGKGLPCEGVCFGLADSNVVGHGDLQCVKSRDTVLALDRLRWLVAALWCCPPSSLHNRTCTWLDLLMVIKNDARKVLLSQAIKQKLQIKSHQQQPQQQQGSSSEDSSQPQEEDKARLLLGAKLLNGIAQSARSAPASHRLGHALPVVGKALADACRSNQWHYAKDSCYTHQQGAGNNWASGYIEHAERGLDSIMELIRRRVERCDWLDGFLPLMSLGGGTGSGLGTKVTEALSQDYPNTPLVNTVVRPFSSGEVAVQAYNAVLSLSHLQDSSDALILLNNDGLHHVASKRWAVKNASLSHLNIVAAQQLACLLQPSKTAEGLPTRIGDVPVELGCHSQLRLVTLLQVPQEPPHVAPFSCATWPGLVRSLHKMRLCRSSTDEGETLFGAPSPASWTCPRRFLGRGRTLLLADNHQGCLSFLEPLLSRAWGRFTEGAFLHHYTRHGLQVEDLADAFVRLEQTLEAYRQLSGS